MSAGAKPVAASCDFSVRVGRHEALGLVRQHDPVSPGLGAASSRLDVAVRYRAGVPDERSSRMRDEVAGDRHVGRCHLLRA